MVVDFQGYSLSWSLFWGIYLRITMHWFGNSVSTHRWWFWFFVLSWSLGRWSNLTSIFFSDGWQKTANHILIIASCIPKRLPEVRSRLDTSTNRGVFSLSSSHMDPFSGKPMDYWVRKSKMEFSIVQQFRSPSGIQAAKTWSSQKVSRRPSIPVLLYVHSFIPIQKTVGVWGISGGFGMETNL